MENNRPLFSSHKGFVSASLWKNSGEFGPYVSCTLEISTLRKDKTFSNEKVYINQRHISDIQEALSGLSQYLDENEV
ncbi:MAG: hypothetical protein KDD55_13560 [Bdellovibrionales bacterium]|nr:hypothetical protein [Bdellovibrionales bacterium]